MLIIEVYFFQQWKQWKIKNEESYIKKKKINETLQSIAIAQCPVVYFVGIEHQKPTDQSIANLPPKA